MDTNWMVWFVCGLAVAGLHMLGTRRDLGRGDLLLIGAVGGMLGGFLRPVFGLPAFTVGELSAASAVVAAVTAEALIWLTRLAEHPTGPKGAH
jgi:hypothetical protein